MAEVFFNVAVVVRTVGGFWSQLDPHCADAARVLGASRWRAFREVTLPLLGPPIAAAASIVFLFTFTAFGVVLLLSDPAHATLEVEIYRQAVQLFDLPTAAALALVQMVAVISLLLVLARMQERRAVAHGWCRPATRRAGRGDGNGWWSAAWSESRACSSAGRSSCSRSNRFDWAANGRSPPTVRSGRARRPTRSSFRPGEALRNSLVFAAIAAVIAMIVGGLASVAIASTTGTGDPLDGHVVDAAARDVGGHGRLRLSRGARPMAGRPASQDRARADRASGGGHPVRDSRRGARAALDRPAPARRGRACSVRRPAAYGARSISRSRCVRSSSVSGSRWPFRSASSARRLFVARPDSPTIPIAISRFLARPGALNVGQAMAMSTILMIVTGSGRARDRAGPRASAR